jgi:hypothetical protein
MSIQSASPATRQRTRRSSFLGTASKWSPTAPHYQERAPLVRRRSAERQKGRPAANHPRRGSSGCGRYRHNAERAVRIPRKKQPPTAAKANGEANGADWSNFSLGGLIDHDTCASSAMSLLKSGMNDGATVNFLRQNITSLKGIVIPELTGLRGLAVRRACSLPKSTYPVFRIVPLGCYVVRAACQRLVSRQSAARYFSVSLMPARDRTRSRCDRAAADQAVR